MKLWQGRMAKAEDERTDALNSSISFDRRMYAQDIQGSIAHATMLGRCGIIDTEEAGLITENLRQILSDISEGRLQIDMASEDIHTFVEAELTKRIGDAGKRLHTARSRNDQVAVDIRLYLRDEIAGIGKMCTELIRVICVLAKEYADVVMPGYTHMQRAQPVSFGHQLLAYAEMLLRDKGRLKDCAARMNYNPLGAGALAGVTYETDRGMTSELLGFSGICRNSIDAVSDRDFVIELLSTLSILMMHLSRFCEEIILWCSWEFRFIELDDAFSTGSSIMPQKKNPDIAELVRGKTGRVYGSLVTLLTVMKGLPLAYNKDMQEDKEAVFDAVDTVKLCISVFTPMLETIRVNRGNMRDAAAQGFINATDCADYLVKEKNVPFRDAYKAVGETVRRCIQTGRTLETLPLEEYREFCPEFGEDVYEAISLENCLERRVSQGGPAPEKVREQAGALLESLIGG